MPTWNKSLHPIVTEYRPPSLIRGIEVTQATQHYQSWQHLLNPQHHLPDNSVQLVANKPALVRVYLRNDWWFSTPERVVYPPGCKQNPYYPDPPPCAQIIPAQTFHFTGTLIISRFKAGYTLLPPYASMVQVDVLNTSGVASDESQRPDGRYAAQRGEGFNTLSFIIPAQKMQGVLHLRVTIQAPNGWSSESTLIVSARLKQTLHLRGIMIRYSGPSTSQEPDAESIALPPPTLGDLQEISPLTLAMFPVQSSAIYSSAGELNCTKPLDDASPTQHTVTPNWLDLLLQVIDHADKDNDKHKYGLGVLYYGLVPIPDASKPHMVVVGVADGVANKDCSVGTFGKGCSVGTFGLGPTDELAMAHELGHALGLCHAPCGDALHIDPVYEPNLYAPYPSASIGEYGVNFRYATPQYMSPQTCFDFMGYCGKRWISPYHYEKLLRHPRLNPEEDEGFLHFVGPYRQSRIPELDLPMPPWSERVQNFSPVISILGIVHGADEIEIRSVARIRVSTEFTSGQKTDLRAELIGDDGLVASHAQVVFRSISLSGRYGYGGCCNEQTDFPYLLQALIPNTERGSALRIRRGEKELWIRRAPQTKAQIIAWHAELLTADRVGYSPDGSTIELAWQASVAGEQTPGAWVQWSGDGGREWSVLATGLQGQAATIDASHLQAGPLSLRLMLDDGFDTAESTPITVELPWREPTVTILTPHDGQTLLSDFPMRLWAAASSQHGTELNAQRIHWLLDGKMIAEDLDSFAIGPAPGQHRLTLVISLNEHEIERTIEFKTISVSKGGMPSPERILNTPT
jgi:hypothetical protein